ncbi:nose resistant to fluoxetine protein 6-like [Lytechinus variegatus]|uniref:nose resistant to fluoxetine protein 6-like n=1 Tax=Lytechinus variegatus TaxID=7654 RepID=UPI001BB11FD7|nr:nose resistant to fluoxetine protein 6-like [Lytechinus variegatus]
MMVFYITLSVVLVICTGCQGNVGNKEGTFLGDAAHYLPPGNVFEKEASIQNVSEVCLADLLKLFSGDPNLFQVVDSFGKPTPGTLVGNTAWIGHYDECMNITDFRYCLVDMGLNITLSANHTLALPINWGVCAPITCHEDDIQNGLEIFLDLLNVSWIGLKDVAGSAVHCTEKPHADFNGGFIGTCVLVSILSMLSIVGTVLDKHITRNQRRRPSLPPLPHGTANGSSGDQRPSQRSTDPSSIYATVDKRRSKDNDPDSVYACVDDLRSDGGKGEVQGQSLNEKQHLSSTDGSYGSTRQREGLHENKVEDREVQIASGTASETTALLAGSHYQVVSVNKTPNSLWKQFLLCFSMSRNLPKILSSKQAAGGIPCLNGIRVISITWIILGHSFSMVMNAGLSENLFVAFGNFLQDFSFQALIAATYAVDSFFLLSGLLLTYHALKKMNENDGKLSWGWLYLHRYIRLTPCLAVIILIWMYFIPYMSQGPVSFRFDDRVKLCHAWWWTDLLYINNFVPPGLRQDCIAWSWYLANDMQFFIISPLLIIPMFWYGVKGMLVLIITCVASFITTAVLVYKNNFEVGILAQGIADTVIESPGTEYMFANDVNGIVYNKPYCRIPPYLVGMALGYAMYNIGNKKLKISPVIAAAGWAVATAIAMAVVYGLYNANRGVSTPSQAANIMSLTFSRFAWALAVSWVIFACHYGYGGVVDDILSWNFWVPLSRLTYSTYLIHPVIQSLYGYSLAVPIHWSVLSLTYLYAGSILLAHSVALVLCVLVEFPFGNMEKMLQTIVQSRHRQRDA